MDFQSKEIFLNRAAKFLVMETNILVVVFDSVFLRDAILLNLDFAFAQSIWTPFLKNRFKAPGGNAR